MCLLDSFHFRYQLLKKNHPAFGKSRVCETSAIAGSTEHVLFQLAPHPGYHDGMTKPINFFLLLNYSAEIMSMSCLRVKHLIYPTWHMPCDQLGVISGRFELLVQYYLISWLGNTHETSMQHVHSACLRTTVCSANTTHSREGQ